MIKTATAALLSFLLFLCLHFAYFHFFHPYEKVTCLLLTAVLGIFIFLLLLHTLPNEAWFKDKLHCSDKQMTQFVFPAFGMLFYGFLILGYLEFYFTADRSITFRMLMITDKQPGQTITQKQMSALYDVPGILNKRFEDLTYGGYYQQIGNEYRLTTKGKLILNIYKIAIEELQLGTGEKQQHV